jgi:hypothetical protein
MITYRSITIITTIITIIVTHFAVDQFLCFGGLICTKEVGTQEIILIFFIFGKMTSLTYYLICP